MLALRAAVRVARTEWRVRGRWAEFSNLHVALGAICEHGRIIVSVNGGRDTQGGGSAMPNNAGAARGGTRFA